jgi:hypothetical protein
MPIKARAYAIATVSMIGVAVIGATLAGNRAGTENIIERKDYIPPPKPMRAPTPTPTPFAKLATEEQQKQFRILYRSLDSTKVKRTYIAKGRWSDISTKYIIDEITVRDDKAEITGTQVTINQYNVTELRDMQGNHRWWMPGHAESISLKFYDTWQRGSRGWKLLRHTQGPIPLRPREEDVVT